jgi:WD40 repeat protein
MAGDEGETVAGPGRDADRAADADTQKALAVDETVAQPSRRPANAQLPTVAPATYEIRHEVARGGMGRVLEARDVRLDRMVALKEVLPGAPGLAARFEREAILTARLQHPSIVTVYEAGRWPGGEPFYAMRLVVGRPLDVVIAEARSFGDRVKLLPQVMAIVDALAYAHSEGVIHRDLKPANVLVGAFGDTVVVDWGLAKRAGDVVPGENVPAVAGDGGLTVTGSVIGTPAFMPPEQARGEDVDARADVYALGAILYTVLCGRRPYADASSSMDALRRVLEGPPQAVEEVEPDVPPDLAAIVRKAMARAAPERYVSAGELAADLRRFQAGQLVGAHRYSSTQLFRRFLRRHRAVLTAAAAGLVILAATGLVSVQRIRRERGDALRAQAEAEARGNALLLTQARTLIGSDPTAAMALLEQFPADASGWGRVRTLAAAARTAGIATSLRRVLGEGVRQIDYLPDGRVVAIGFTGRDLVILDPRDGRRHTLTYGDCRIRAFASFAISPDGRSIAASGCDARVLVWDVASGVARTLQVPGLRAGIVRLVWSPDARTLAACGRFGVFVLDLASGAARAVGGAGWRRSAAFSPDGRYLAVASGSDVPAELEDLARGTTRVLGTGFQPAFSPDSRHLALADAHHAIRVLDLATGRERVLSGPADIVTSLAFSPDGRSLASASRDWTLRLFDLGAGTSDVIRGHHGPVVGLQFARDGSSLVSWDEGDVLLLTPLADRRVRVLHGRSAALSPTGADVCVGGEDGALRIFAVAPADPRALGDAAMMSERVVFSPDGRQVATVGHDHRVAVWSLATGRAQWLAGDGNSYGPVAFGSDGRSLVVLGPEHTPWIFDLETGGFRDLHFQRVADARALSADARLFASAQGQDLEILDLRTGALTLHGRATAPIQDVWLSATGSLAVTANSDHAVNVWSPADGRQRVLLGHADRVFDVAFSSDGRWIATASGDRTVRLWPTAGGDPRVFRGHDNEVQAVAFSPDGRTLASGSTDGTLRLWDVGDGTSRLLRGGVDLRSIVWSADGRTIGATGRWIEVWDVATGERRELPEEGANDLAASPSGGWFAVAGTDGATLWRDDLPHDPQQLVRWMRAATIADAPP